jgi:hypothetical protein
MRGAQQVVWRPDSQGRRVVLEAEQLHARGSGNHGGRTPGVQPP